MGVDGVTVRSWMLGALGLRECQPCGREKGSFLDTLCYFSVKESCPTLQEPVNCSTPGFRNFDE